jgi:hypothetical protein
MPRKKKLVSVNDRFNQLLRQGRDLGSIRRVASYAGLEIEFARWIETLPSIPSTMPLETSESHSKRRYKQSKG